MLNSIGRDIRSSATLVLGQGAVVGISYCYCAICFSVLLLNSTLNIDQLIFNLDIAHSIFIVEKKVKKVRYAARDAESENEIEIGIPKI